MTSEASNIVKGFQSLFYSARREYRIWKQNVTLDPEFSQKALVYAEEQNLAGADILIRVSFLEGQGEYEEALTLVIEASSEISPLLESVSLHLQGILHHSIARKNPGPNHHKRAIESYKNSLAAVSDDITYPATCHVLVDLAQAYGDTGGKLHSRLMEESYARIIDFKTVTPLKNCSIPGRAWIRIAQIFKRNGEVESTIKAYKNATQDPIDDPLYEVPSAPWLYLGREYFSLGSYDKAIDAFRKALELNFPRPAVAWNLIGKAYYLKGDYVESKYAFEQVLEQSEGTLSSFNREANRAIELISAGLRPEALSPNDLSIFWPGEISDVIKNTPEQRILRKIDNAETDQYQKYLNKDDSGRDNTLSILRGWSSAVMLIEGSEQTWPGGGYFIKWKGKGIVIDPGFGFLRNFHDASYHGREIDAVIVSHNHPDHNADLTHIDNLRYEIYKRCKGKDKAELSPYGLLWDTDSQEAIKLPSDKPEHRSSPIVFSIGLCDPEHEFASPNKLPISVQYFRVTHGGLSNAIGCKIILHNEAGKDFTIGYTGDTEFFPGLSICLSNCDILLAHISQPSREELIDHNVRKKDHLGYRGLAELIKTAEPKVTLVGEFWGGLADLRVDLIQGLRKLTGINAILPTGIGMHVALPTLEIECSACHKNVSVSKTHVAPPHKPFSKLSYLCPDCFLD